MYRYENPLTRQDIETIVENSIGPQINILDYHFEQYSNQVLGFLGAHRNLIIEISRDNKSQTTETQIYFVKSVPYNIEKRAKFVEDGKIFEKETSFYNLMMPELLKSSKDMSWTAQCYLVKNDVLVFENLKIRNYTIKEKFLDMSSLKAALSSLAKLHGASLLMEKRLGKSLLELYPETIREIVFTRDGPFAHGIGLGIDTATKIAKSLGLNFNVVGKICDLIFERMVPSKTRRNVLNHGDVWSNNFMFNGDKCALVDFQLTRYVPAMIDVAQLIYYNARRELREKCEMDLLKYYHEVLCEVLKDDREMILPRFEDILEEYEEMRIVGIITICLYFPMNQIDGKTLAEMVKNPERLDRLMAKDRANVVFELMKENDGYKELIEATIMELIEVSEKFLKCN